MSVWMVILLAGLGSYLFRISMVLLVEQVGVPDILSRASGFVAPAAFAALAAGGLAARASGADLAQAVPMLAAVTAAAAVVHRTRRPYLAIVAGMPVLWALTLAMGA